MSGIKLDLKGFKHVSSDERSTTLKHANGHEIKLAHNVLSKAAQQQLKALGQSAKDAETNTQKEEAEAESKDSKSVSKQTRLAEGGVVDKVGSYLDDLADRVSGNKKEVPYKNPGQRKITGERKRNPMTDEVPSYADGGDVENPVDKALQLDTSEKAIEEMANNPNQYTTSFNTPPESGVSKYQEVVAEAANKGQAEKQAYEKALLQAGQPESMSQPVEQPQGLAQPQPQQPQQPQPQQEAQQPTGDLMADYSNKMTSGLDTQMKGIQAQAAAEAALGQEQAKIQQKLQADTQDIITKFDKKNYELEDTLKQHEQDIKDGYIDPNKYWTGYTLPNGQKVEGHSKMAATIGMLIAGFGGNNGVKMLQDQIDQSLDAQKKNLDTSHNLLKANLDHFKNVNEATQMTKAMMIDAATAQLQAAASKAKSPLAQAAALQAIGPLQQQKAQLMFNMSLNKTVNDLTDENPGNTSKAEHTVGMLRQMNMPEKAKELQERIVPGVGVATIPVPQKTRDELVEHQELNNKATKLMSLVKSKAGLKGLNPLDPDVIAGKQMVLELQSAVRESKLGTVYKEGEQPLLDKFVNENPMTILGKVESIPKLQQLIKSNDASANILKKSVGIKAAPQAQQAEPVERIDKSTGKIALFDPSTKKFLGYKK